VRTPLRFDLNGVSVEVDIPASAARDAIAARFDRCPPAPPGDADVSFLVRTGSGTGRPEGRGRPVYPWDVGEVTYFDGPRSLYISVGDHTRLLAEPASGRVEITTHAAMLDAAWLLARPLLTLPLGLAGLVTGFMASFFTLFIVDAPVTAKVGALLAGLGGLAALLGTGAVAFLQAGRMYQRR